MIELTETSKSCPVIKVIALFEKDREDIAEAVKRARMTCIAGMKKEPELQEEYLRLYLHISDKYQKLWHHLVSLTEDKYGEDIVEQAFLQMTRRAH